jgi:hypothetical protein
VAVTAGSEVFGRLPIGDGRVHGAARYPEEAETARGAPVPQEAPLAPPRPVVGGIGRLLIEGGDDLGEQGIGQDAGILDWTHLRFFTLSEIDSLFAGAGYGPRNYTATTVPISDQDLVLVDALKGLSTTNTSDQFRVYQYLVKVTR